MRSVMSDFIPGEAMAQGRVGDRELLDRASQEAAAPKERAIWYWAEDPSRMSSHASSLTLPPHWVQYAGSVAAELEEQHSMYLSDPARATYVTDLTDRISSTGTEAKAHGQGTGSQYTMNFAEMKQINNNSGYKRDIMRRVVEAGGLSVAP